MNQIKKIVFTGGPYAGKSTLIKYFDKLGYPVLNEVSISIINQLNRELGVEGSINFRQKQTDEFERILISRQKELENIAAAKAIKKGSDFVIFDRGVFDAMSYYKFYSKTPPKDILNMIRDIKYDLVFVLNTLPDYDARTETGRFETKEDSELLCRLAYEAYSETCDNVLYLPVMSVEDRYQEVISTIKSL